MLDCSQTTQRSLPLELGSQIDELAEVVLGQPLLLYCTGDFEPTRSTSSLTVAGPPCCLRKPRILLDRSRDDSTETLRVVIRLVIISLDSPIIHRPLVA